MKRFFFMNLILFALLVPGLSFAGPQSLQEGKGYYEQGEFQKAYGFFFNAFKENPLSVEINFYLGRSAFGMGDFEAAVMAFERVLIIEPDAAEAKVELATSYFRLGSIEIAKHYFAEALEGELPEKVRKSVLLLLEELKGTP